jgi:membrane-associated protease RseP (regulator of RpoE activity)
MKRTQSTGAWDTLLIIAVAALAVTFSHATHAVADDTDAEGRIVEISPEGNEAPQQVDEQVTEEGPVDQAVEEAPVYWLGIEGMQLDSPVLRTHLQLADDVGIVVRAVSPNSPAEKAGFRQHDIILSVNGEQVTGMETLQRAVADSHAKPLDLKIIRLAKEMTIAVTPETMPAEVAQAMAEATSGQPGNFNFNFQDLPMEALNDVLKDFDVNVGGGMRIVGPGMIVKGGSFDVGKVPGGVSVQITRENDGPATITVKKGGKTWTVEGKDEEALKKLPDDVRPMVEQLLGAQQGPKPFIKQFQLGQGGGGFGPANWGRIDGDAIRQRTEEANKRILKQMEQMEKRLQEMQERINERFPAEDANPPLDPSKT